MARPIKNNADYFPHDADMRNDPRMRALRRKFGIEGYGCYCMVLELLTDADHFQFKNDSLSLELVAGDIDIETGKLESILQYCFQLDLFQLDTENNVIRCKTLRNRLEPLLSKRKRERTIVIDNDNTHSKVKESKGKETKENESIYTLGPDSEKFILIYPQMLNASKYRLNGYEGVFDFYQINRSICPKEGVVSKFIRDNNGKHFNDFMHLYNSISKYMEKKYVG